MTILKTYIDEAASGDLLHDDGQVEVISLLENLLQTLSKKKTAFPFLKLKRPLNNKSGIYIWGGVGTGKTMLMDKFFKSCTVKNKTRVHFHTFMQDIHKSLFDLRKKEKHDPIKKIIKMISTKTDLLCFDELQITDITDAMLVGRLFEGLLNSEVKIVATSNRSPEDLYKDGLNRQLFLPFIKLLTDSLKVHEIKSEIDYRQKKLSSEKLYFHPINKKTKNSINTLWSKISDNKIEKLNICINDRNFLIKKYTNGMARIDFHELCGVPLGPADYLAITNKLRLIIIENIPILSPANANEAKRFITLIDTLYEAKVKLICSAEDTPEKLYQKGSGSFEFSRTSSRLIEMQSSIWHK